MEQIQQFLQGKKTYISAFVIALAACCGWWFHAINDTQLIALLGVAGAAAGLGAKSQRNAELILAGLSDLRRQHCQHRLAKWIGGGQQQCCECGDIFTPPDSVAPQLPKPGDSAK